jgi:hypothetical protein
MPMRGVCAASGHGHNRPAFLAAELRHRLLEQVKRPANVDGKGLLPVFLAQRIGRPHPQNTGGIDQHIQPRDPCQQAAARLRHLLRVGNVQRLGGERIAFAVERQIKPVTCAPASTNARAVA